MMMLIVTGVGSLIVAYSVGYMDGEDEERRYFAYMSLFVFSMLLLVQGGNLLLLLAGWGMVGLSSYLLIGFYQDRAVGDRGGEEGVRDERVRRRDDGARALPADPAHRPPRLRERVRASPHGGAVANLIALGLLGGALAKSAQIPLHTWLPDAMEGPTPVSALIHAATMVTAGVYLIVRCHPLFENAYVIQDLAAGLGAATLLMAGLIALVQTDIKRVIAYSTMSQIGYMFVGAGLGAYPSAMFHLMTHAFFKALLFLAAGIAIHAIAGEQDIRKLGGHRQADAAHEDRLPDRLARARRHPAVRRLLLEGLDPRRRARPRLVRRRDLRRRPDRRVPDRPLRVPALLHRLHRRADARSRASTSTRHHGKEGPLSMRWTVGVLGVLSRGRRLPAVRAALASAHRLARAGRRADRRADEHAGVRSRRSSRSRSASPASASRG